MQMRVQPNVRLYWGSLGVLCCGCETSVLRSIMAIEIYIWERLLTPLLKILFLTRNIEANELMLAKNYYTKTSCF